MKRRLRIYAAILGALVVLKLAWFALEAESGAAIVPAIAEAPCARLVERLDTLLERLTGPDDLGWATAQMDEQFQGEWRIVSLSMTSIASANLAMARCTTRERAVDVTGRLLERALSTEARAFDTAQWGEDALATLEHDDGVRHGHIGYLAHLAMVMSAHRAVGGVRHDEERVRIIDALARRVTEAPTVYLPTYPGETYAMDNSVVIAAIGVDGRYPEVVARFMAHTRARLLDPRTGLVVFALDGAGAPTATSRGSGAGWNSFWLPFADRAFASEQWARLREHFLVDGVGLTACREFPVGVGGVGDADSGPVLLGLSPAGTGFAIGGAAWAQDASTLGGLLGTAELAGFTTSFGGRRYLLAPVVGDAIVLAMTTARPWSR